MTVRVVARKLVLERDCDCGVRLHYDPPDVFEKQVEEEVMVTNSYETEMVTRFFITCAMCKEDVQVSRPIR